MKKIYSINEIKKELNLSRKTDIEPTLDRLKRKKELNWNRIYDSSRGILYFVEFYEE